MKYVLFLIVVALPCFGMHPNTKEEGYAYAQRVSDQTRQIADILYTTDQRLDGIIRVATVNLAASGYSDLANQIQNDWETAYKGSLLRDERGIGHVVLIQWIKDVYDAIESKLGVETCKILHLSDLLSVDAMLGVLIGSGAPCNYDMTGVSESRKQDFIENLSHDDVYYGGLAVLTWWGISIECWVGTSGVGAFLCSLAADAAQWTMGYVIAPPVAEDLFGLMCPDQA